MIRKLVFLFALIITTGIFTSSSQIANPPDQSWIRINLLGYKPSSPKIAVFGSKESKKISSFELVDVSNQNIVFQGKPGNPFGAYGPFAQTYRLNFSSFNKPGRYIIRAANAISPEFTIGEDVYKGAADFCLRYMRQQRTGFNPFLKDSCHTRDGYTLYGPMPDSTHIDVVGGWHDASDYLQYATTSANATYHLLMAYRDFPGVFSDTKQANGLEGSNGRADVLDEAKWGLDWLLKMHPKRDWMFNQIADDRDHMGMRIPKEDTFYGKGIERPVYFLSGLPQQRGKFMNNTTGTSSTAGKFSSAFSLGSQLFADSAYRDLLFERASSSYQIGRASPGFAHTASVRAPYIYEESNWVDDMELACAIAYTSYKKYFVKEGYSNVLNPDLKLQCAYEYAKKEPVTPWLGKDTATHYQWYPFINLGHYELGKHLKGKQRNEIVGYYKQGIQLVWNKAKQNAFFRGIPFIWCSNNLTTSFATQCFWYRELTNDNSFLQLEQANFDWLFGCNPWGTSFVYGLPSNGDTPTDPHSAFTRLKNYPIDGGLVDGPVYASIYNNLIGIKLYQPDEYAEFQSKLVVYHDDYGDYSTNEPTMDGTASLIYLLAAKEMEGAKNLKKKALTHERGAIRRGDSTMKQMAIVFTGDAFGEGGEFIRKALGRQKIKASFFLTGIFYRNPSFRKNIQQLINAGHYLGAHSDQHLLYCDWFKRDSLLVTKEEFNKDLDANYKAMEAFGIARSKAKYFLPPYEWYNDTIAGWTKAKGFQLVNYTAGTISHADYTTPDLKNYRSSEEIIQSIINYETNHPAGLNGFILIMHIGAGPDREDKLYLRLPELLSWLREKNYEPVRIDELLKD